MLRAAYASAARDLFTQEDPIGLAGGTNLYGFAGGDRINFSDPMGLSPCCVHPPGLTEAIGKAAEEGRRANKVVEIDGQLFQLQTGTAPDVGGAGRAAREWLGAANRAIPGLNRQIAGWFKSGGDLPKAISKEYLENYLTAASDAISRGVDRLGVQAKRVEQIQEVLKKWK